MGVEYYSLLHNKNHGPPSTKTIVMGIPIVHEYNQMVPIKHLKCHPFTQASLPLGILSWITSAGAEAKVFVQDGCWGFLKIHGKCNENLGLI